MLDLETLGNTRGAPIVQIGAAKFKDDGTVLASFIRNIDLNSLEKYNFEVDYKTVGWWLSQEDAAIKSVFCSEPRVNIRQALHEFIEWIEHPTQYLYWSHATFDPPILMNNIAKVGLPNVIPFRAWRDIRTLTHFTGKISGGEREGIHHNALDDCLYQVKYVSEGIRRLQAKLGGEEATSPAILPNK